MQLVAYGAQDIYLTGNPQITFFKVVYRRHTNFAVESIEQTFSGDAGLGKKVSCTVARNGDLLSRVYLEMDIKRNGGNNFNPRVGFEMIDYVELEIGGQCIDKHYGDWMDVWAQLSHDGDSWDKLNRLINGSLTLNGAAVANGDVRKLYVPLQFWFCCNPGLALPLIALQYHEVKINIQFKPSSANVTSIENVCVFCDYVFLDTDERRRFAQVSHEYLIEQLQYSNALTQANGNDEHELRFNHPVKELVWTLNNKAPEPFNYWNGAGLDMVKDAILQLNGHDRFRRRQGTYFRCVQPYQHHTGGHQQNNATDMGGFYCYSFALKPEDHQPSGTCNFSRIDNAVLSVNSTAAATIKIYAVNYNVLRIMSGMGGLAYSN